MVTTVPIALLEAKLLVIIWHQV